MEGFSALLTQQHTVTDQLNIEGRKQTDIQCEENALLTEPSIFIWKREREKAERAIRSEGRRLTVIRTTANKSQLLQDKHRWGCWLSNIF